MKTCSECGASASDYAKFCQKCGSNFYIKCPECGHELEKTALFCDSCGAKCQQEDDWDIEDTSLPEKILGTIGEVVLTLFMLDE